MKTQEYNPQDEQIMQMLTPNIEVKPSLDLKARILKAAAEQSKAADAKAHDGTALEGDLQGLADVAGLVGLVGDADVGVGGDLHADETGACAHNGAEEQSHTGMPGEQNGENDRNDDDDDGEDKPLP